MPYEPASSEDIKRIGELDVIVLNWGGIGHDDFGRSQ